VRTNAQRVHLESKLGKIILDFDFFALRVVRTMRSARLMTRRNHSENRSVPIKTNTCW